MRSAFSSVYSPPSSRSIAEKIASRVSSAMRAATVRHCSTAKAGWERKRSSSSWKSSMRSTCASSRMVSVASFTSALPNGSSTHVAAMLNAEWITAMPAALAGRSRKANGCTALIA